MTEGSFRKIQVCCSYAVTGGPELLHQLVHELRTLGHDASIVYLPLGGSYETPPPYRIYNAPQSSLLDEPDVLVIAPEVATRMLWRLRRASKAVWWLSVDYYFGIIRESWLRDARRWYRTLLTQRVPLAFLKKYQHYAQSQYAVDFLRGAGIEPEVLTDYLSADHFEQQVPGAADRRNIVVYNPRKGVKVTAALRKATRHLDFVPIENMTPREVAELLRSAKLYVDFGHHPGKDRLPREAAMAGCCVITGRRGSAGNSSDVSIPEVYKLDETRPDFAEAFSRLAGAVLHDYPTHNLDFEPYRSHIRLERSVFQDQVKRIFGTGHGFR